MVFLQALTIYSFVNAREEYLLHNLQVFAFFFAKSSSNTHGTEHFDFYVSNVFLVLAATHTYALLLYYGSMGRIRRMDIMLAHYRIFAID